MGFQPTVSIHTAALLQHLEAKCIFKRTYVSIFYSQKKAESVISVRDGFVSRVSTGLELSCC